ncbi:MAG: hypothetical protein ACJAR2_002791 [Ilumatobacter sp.]
MPLRTDQRSALDLELDDFSTAINPERFNYIAEVCTRYDIEIYGLEPSIGSNS